MLTNYLIPKILGRKKMSMYFKANINAHSDDSAGRFESNNEESLIEGIKLYEIMLALCNHNLSLKKCNLSKLYFEFLSILYLKGKLVPLVGKFISNIEFNPSDKGPSQDLIKGITESIEILSMGGSFEEAFLKKWLYGKMVLDFYKIKTRTDILPQLFGIPCSHPFLDLVVGSKSDLLRLHAKNKYSVSHQLFISANSSDVKDDINLSSLTMKPIIRVAPELKKQEESLKTLLSPIISFFKTKYEETSELLSLLTMSSEKHYLTGLLRYLKLYQTQSYTSSLMYETKTRMISRALFSVSQKCVRVMDTDCKPREVIPKVDQLLCQINEGVLKIGDTIFDFVECDGMKEMLYKPIFLLDEFFKETLDFFERMRFVNLENKTFTPISLTAKPVVIEYQNNKTGLILSSRVNEIILSKKYPEFEFMVMPFKLLSSEYDEIKKLYPRYDDKDFCTILSKFNKSSNKEIHIFTSKVRTQTYKM